MNPAKLPLLLFAASLPLLDSCAPAKPDLSSLRIPATGALDDRLSTGVNSYRTSVGKPSLTRHSGLDSLARQHSISMLKGRNRRMISHDGFSDRAATAFRSYGITSFAENVAYTSRGHGAPAALVRLWAESPPHRKSMLGRWQFTGIGTAVDADGTVFATQVFGNGGR